jgi:hypothetical protein
MDCAQVADVERFFQAAETRLVFTMKPQKIIFELAIGADWACVHGEFAALGDVIRRLSESVAEPLHCELVAFADLCVADPARASNAWPRIREQLFQAAR